MQGVPQAVVKLMDNAILTIRTPEKAKSRTFVILSQVKCYLSQREVKT